MANITRITATWSGVPGLPGYTNFYFNDALGMVDSVVAFFDAMKNAIPSNIAITVSPDGDVLDAATGELTGTFTGTGGGVVGGGGNTEHAGPAGAVVNLGTSSINRGRRVRGRFFVVPLSAAVFDSNGSLIDSWLSPARAGAAAFLAATSGEYVVWSRPRSGSGGMAAPVTSITVPDLAAVLRSRRD